TFAAGLAWAMPSQEVMGKRHPPLEAEARVVPEAASGAIESHHPARPIEGQLPLEPGGRGAADPDRARLRLVGSDPVLPWPAPGPAQGRPQSDVGDPGRARDRNLD